MNVGIFFGGNSKEREISFAGGRTVFDNLNKSIFTPVPIFVDSFNNFVLLDWQFIYKGSIRDFYPKSDKNNLSDFVVYAESLNLNKAEQTELLQKIGKPIKNEDLADLIDFAFLALHGKFGEDGTIQALLENLQIPYSGSGILPCAIGIDKHFQRKMMQNSKFNCPAFLNINFTLWQNKKDYKNLIFEQVKKEIDFPLIVRPSKQGSSIGVGKVENSDFDEFCKKVENAFFIETIEADFWQNCTEYDQILFLEELTDFRTGIGLPVKLNEKIIYHPSNLHKEITKYFTKHKTLKLYALDGENEVLVEPFIFGREFSCIVLKQKNKKVVALPPTEIVKGKEIFDYRSKYLAGLSRKKTPIDLDDETILKIQQECIELYSFFNFNVYARIDGFLKEDGTIILNDPNTTSGMLPSSFFFHQAAEVGINPSEFITFIIYQSLFERKQSIAFNGIEKLNILFDRLNQQIENQQNKRKNITKIGVIFGGYSSERHISVESGRNIYEKLSSSSKYEPIPIFLTKENDELKFYQIPINILLKDNADDINDKILNLKPSYIIDKAKTDCKFLIDNFVLNKQINDSKEITLQQLAKMVDGTFIGLHGRPGEDGELQKLLDSVGLPYNGSSPKTSKITINKYLTNQQLSDLDFNIAKQQIVFKQNFEFDNILMVLDMIETEFTYPFVAKPVDDGCSSAVKIIKNREELLAFSKLIFRDDEALLDEESVAILKLQAKEEFPTKEIFLIEELVKKDNNLKHFLEITVGLLMEKIDEANYIEIFEPSEVISKNAVLSLEEKFLAGEGQNITPARFDFDDKVNEKITNQVKAEIKRLTECLNIEGYARVDAFVKIYNDNTIKTYIIEVNSLPGMTPATCIFHQAAINGYKPFNFIDKILEYSFKKHEIEKVF